MWNIFECIYIGLIEQKFKFLQRKVASFSFLYPQCLECIMYAIEVRASKQILVAHKGYFDPQHIKMKYITKEEFYSSSPWVEEQSPDIRQVSFHLSAQSLKSHKMLCFLYLFSIHTITNLLYFSSEYQYLTPKQTLHPVTFTYCSHIDLPTEQLQSGHSFI